MVPIIIVFLLFQLINILISVLHTVTAITIRTILTQGLLAVFAARHSIMITLITEYVFFAAIARCQVISMIRAKDCAAGFMGAAAEEAAACCIKLTSRSGLLITAGLQRKAVLSAAEFT